MTIEVSIESQPMETQAYEVRDFKGGITDYILDAPENMYQEADNLLIVQHGDYGKLFTRPGSEIYDATYYQIPAGAQRIGTYKYFESQLFIQSARKLYYINSGWTTLQGPTSNDLFPTGADTTTVVSTGTWNKHLFITGDNFSKVSKVYKDGSNVWQLRTAGMPALASTPTTTAGTVGTTYHYLYRYLYYYTYTVGTVVFVDRGPTTEHAATAAANITTGAGNTMSHTAIPVLSNSTTYNYDTASANLKVEIYRTVDGGTAFYKVGSVNNGTTVYSDTTGDAALILNEPLYTEGGLPDFQEPPLCKYLHVVDNYGFFGHTKEGSEVKKNRLYQSIADDIDSVPARFFTELQDEITGISSYRSNPIVTCLKFVYRIDGRFDDFGQGGLLATKISDVAGGVSNSSIVQTPVGIFWAGNEGFYWSDGYEVKRITDHLDKTYAILASTATRRRRIVGVYDPKKNKVWWGLQKASNATEVDACFILDLNYGVSDKMPFTTASNGSDFAPTALEVIDGNLVRGDTRGYTFLHRDTLYVDPKIDVTGAPSTWVSKVIPYSHITAAISFGSNFMRKLIPRITVQCKNETNLSLLIRSVNDDGKKTADLKPIRFRGNITWGDADVYWGDPGITWNVQGLINEQRRFPATNLRCSYKQVSFSNAFVAILTSETLGTATVNGTTKTATLTNTSAFDWPTGAIDFYLAFDTDLYQREYLVTGRTNDVLTFSDSSNFSPTAAGVSWVLRGYPKGEVLHLLGYVIHYVVLGKTQDMYRASSTGEVGSS